MYDNSFIKLHDDFWGIADTKLNTICGVRSMEIEVTNNLRKFRQWERMTLDQLSKASGVSKSMISNIEKGKGLPGIEAAYRLSIALDWSLLDVFQYRVVDKKGESEE